MNSLKSCHSFLLPLVSTTRQQELKERQFLLQPISLSPPLSSPSAIDPLRQSHPPDPVFLRYAITICHRHFSLFVLDSRLRSPFPVITPFRSLLLSSQSQPLPVTTLRFPVITLSASGPLLLSSQSQPFRLPVIRQSLLHHYTVTPPVIPSLQHHATCHIVPCT